jgi:hypothetical protein
LSDGSLFVDLVLALQALIFLLKREFMLVGWMIIYIWACVWSEVWIGAERN